MLRPDLANDAVRFLKKRDGKQFIQILQAVAELCANPRPVDSIAMGNGRHFRKDVGEFRVIYRYNNEFLFVTVIGNRNDAAAYKEFNRKSQL